MTNEDPLGFNNIPWLERLMYSGYSGRDDAYALILRYIIDSQKPTEGSADAVDLERVEILREVILVVFPTIENATMADLVTNPNGVYLVEEAQYQRNSLLIVRKTCDGVLKGFLFYTFTKNYFVYDTLKFTPNKAQRYCVQFTEYSSQIGVDQLTHFLKESPELNPH